MVLGSIEGTLLEDDVGSSVGPVMVREGGIVATVREGLEGR